MRNFLFVSYIVWHINGDDIVCNLWGKISTKFWRILQKELFNYAIAFGG